LGLKIHIIKALYMTFEPYKAPIPVQSFMFL